MPHVTRAADRFRGGDPAAGIDTRHAFSFADHYDPENVRLGPLTACNEERLAPGAGFPPHAHRDVEIVSWVLSGELTHEDEDGRATVVRPGDLQRLTAGAGVRHVERNAGPEPLRFLQMWLIPAEPGGEPAYEVVRGIADDIPYALPRTPAVLRVRRLGDGERTTLPGGRLGYLHLAAGAAELTGTGPAVALTAGDAVRLTDDGEAAVRAAGAAELLMWELSG
ncbi:pirin family protein [Streptomyces hainanensis]|uniref:Pirin family protein n=1 Tax=Streptomyces hainanensis TaxID=402648 RepID=A0A4R4TH47_9ACTN|nr:pirin family protein [Streptomyces hainanensis]TDC73659.1 pirin family protein [Streptomyces hainanensis]